MKKVLSILLVLALCPGLSVPARAAGFSDVAGSHPFCAAIMDCVEKGIIGGMAAINRGQACVVIGRLSQYVPIAAASTSATQRVVAPDS